VDFLSAIDELVVASIRIGGVFDSRQPLKGHRDPPAIFELEHDSGRAEIDRGAAGLTADQSNYASVGGIGLHSQVSSWARLSSAWLRPRDFESETGLSQNFALPEPLRMWTWGGSPFSRLKKKK
jgi:hypothetical protein